MQNFGHLLDITETTTTKSQHKNWTIVDRILDVPLGLVFWFDGIKRFCFRPAVTNFTAGQLRELAQFLEAVAQNKENDGK